MCTFTANEVQLDSSTKASVGDSSASSLPIQHETAVPSGDRIYSVATGNKLTSLMNEYRRRKQVHSVTTGAPKVAVRSSSRKSSLKASEDETVISKEKLDEERKASIMKVGEMKNREMAV